MDRQRFRNRIKKTENALNSRVSSRAIDFKQFLDDLMPVALILLVSLFLFHFVVPVGETVSKAVNFLNISLILFFSVRLVLSFALASSHRKFLKNHWFDALLVIPALVLLKEIRLFLLLESETEEKAFLSFFFARSTTVAGQIAKMYNLGRRMLRL